MFIKFGYYLLVKYILFTIIFKYYIKFYNFYIAIVLYIYIYCYCYCYFYLVESFHHIQEFR